MDQLDLMIKVHIKVLLTVHRDISI